MHVAGFRSLPEHKVFLLAAGDRETDRDSLRTQGETEGEHASPSLQFSKGVVCSFEHHNSNGSCKDSSA